MTVGQDVAQTQDAPDDHVMLQPDDDLLWRQLKTVPAFRALLRSVEARFYRKLELPGPVLDLGCGDGHFAEMALEKEIAAGLDPWWGPLNKSKARGQYHVLTQAVGNAMPFPDACFGSIFSNSVLEHIPDIEPVLMEANRVLRPGGTLVITTPSHYFTEFLGGAAFLERLGLPGLAVRYRAFFNFISRHAHTDAPQIWAERLADAGFAVDRWQYYYSKDALRALEWGHLQGIPSAILHALTGWWVIAPWKSSLAWTESWLRPYYEEEAPAQGAYLLFIAHKAAAHEPVTAVLPIPEPFKQSELREKQKAQIRPQPLPAGAAAVPEPRAAANVGAPVEAHVPSRLGPQTINAGLLLLTLLSAMLGQAILNTAPETPWGGLRWYGLAVAAGALLALRRYGRKLPDFSFSQLRAIPRRRWFYPLALFMSATAYRQAASATVPGRPILALLLWIAAIIIAIYALTPVGPASRETRWLPPTAVRLDRLVTPNRIIAIVLFLVAFNLRLFDLSRHPFILSGTEANIGLDALAVADGRLTNPFGTGWLTNPTLPLYLISIPLRILGPSTLSIRLLSPLIGALTVAATYVIGTRLWRREVGLVAAIFMLGSHFHVHYSRLGMTNIWDPLIVLLAFGLLLIAWRRESTDQKTRLLWTGAGLCLGLTAYFFTSGHLILLMLGAFIALQLLLNRPALRRRSAGLWLAGLMALVVALPQITYYNNSPGVFMDRANVLGIFQTGWLQQQSNASGQTELDILVDQLAAAALAFNYSVDRSSAYNPGVPLLQFWPALFLVLGVAWAVGRLREPRFAALLAWLATTIFFAGALLLDPPNSHRLIIAAPAIFLLAAVPFVWLFDQLIASAPSLRPYAVSVTAGIAILIVLLDVVFYFGTYRNQPRFGDRNTEVAHEMVQYLESLPGEWSAYFYGPPVMYVGFPNIPFAATDFQQGVNLFDVTDGLDALPAPNQPNVTLIYLPERYGELTDAQQRFPGGETRAFAGVYADPLFYVYEVRGPAP